MAAQIGSELLVKINTTGSTFVAMAGLRTKSVQMNAEQVDVTNSDSASKYRELLAGAGIKSLSVSGSGVFTDDTTHETARAAWAAGTLKDFQIVIPGWGTWEGAFQITQLAVAGEHNGEVTYDITLESADAPAWTAS